ncbi:hypothetical protein I350_01983 [Cryptococcus amylolentus CBS 6273]|uniref:Uncharacterized protein n=1 Tax=Cryptococcus amylolentus CBS 6273 TaxID=1296118 RepID=A0A1E3K9Z1_9TREE|nr:hypothetical protein I350_01983 [Cryptococcus amylolentus CBS 6273]
MQWVQSGKRLKLDASSRATLAQLAKMSFRELLASSILESLDARRENQELKAEMRALTKHVAIPLTKEIKDIMRHQAVQDMPPRSQAPTALIECIRGYYRRFESTVVGPSYGPDIITASKAIVEASKVKNFKQFAFTSPLFPYRAGDEVLNSEDAAVGLMETWSTECLQCRQHILLPGLRRHVGKHIMAAMLRQKENLDKRGTPCKRFFAYHGKNAEELAEFTNHPYHCPVEGCGKVMWKYNMRCHYDLEHPQLIMPTKFKVKGDEVELLSLTVPKKRKVAPTVSKFDAVEKETEEGRSAREIVGQNGKRARIMTKKAAGQT